MTRQEFIDDVTTVDELYRINYEYDLHVLDEIYSRDGMDETVDEEASDILNQRGWVDCRDYLDSVPVGYDWYEYVDGEWYGLEDGSTEFDDYKQRVLEAMEENGDFDDEEFELEEADLIDIAEEPVDDFDPFENGCSFDELFSAKPLQAIKIEVKSDFEFVNVPNFNEM